MKKAIIYVFFLFASVNTFAQQKEILNVFHSQIKAFNEENVEQMVKNISEDYKYYYVSSDKLLLEVEGKDQFKKSMQSYFGAGMQVKSKILEYSILGNKISFKEEVTYKNKKGKWVSASSLGVYQIEKGKITRTWYFL